MLNAFLSKIVKCFSSRRINEPTVDGNDMHGAILPPDAYITNTETPKGRGVFASRDFREGEVVERCPVLIIEEPVNELPEQLRAMVIDWGVLANTDASSAVVLGFGGLYKHDDQSNLCYEIDTTLPGLLFTANRAIKKNEELTVSYDRVGGGAVWNVQDWR